MKWSCPKCNYQWTEDMETFDKVLAHEKTHKKTSKDISNNN